MDEGDDQDPYDLGRFVSAQRPVWATAMAELRAGEKRSHWMWFVFPQLAGLGRSERSRFYAIRGLDEARAYLAHPLLGPRLAEATRALLAHPDRSAESMLKPIDAMKLHSSLTLFLEAGAGAPLDEALDRLFGGERDGATLQLLAAASH